MKTSTNCVAPEEVMAFIDGELSDFEGQLLSAHLRQCTECSSLAEGFRETSRMLSEWTVPATAARLDVFSNALSETSDRRGAIAKKRAPEVASRSKGMRKFWAIGWGLLASPLLLLIFVFFAPPYRRRAMLPVPVTTQSLSMAIAPMEVEKSQVSSRSLLVAKRADEPDGVAAVRGYAAPSVASTSAAPMIARTVSLSLEVKNLSVSRSTADGILARHHGYIAQLNVQYPDNSIRSVVASLRIPASDLDAAVTELRTLGRVQAETQSGEEVTQQHMDLVARLANSRETESRLQAILRERTGSVSDVLKVENEIARVRGEIEGMEADQKALEHRVDFTTVELQLTEEYKAELSPPADSVSTRMHNAFVEGYRDASGTLLGIVLFLEEFVPVILIWVVLLGVPLLLIWRRYRKTH